MCELRKLTDTELKRVLHEHPEWAGDNLTDADLVPLVCPSDGAFIGWKKCRDNLIVKLPYPRGCVATVWHRTTVPMRQGQSAGHPNN